MMKSVIAIALLVLSVLSFGSLGCAIVPQNRRAKLADPMMSLTPGPLESYCRQKLYSTREGAAGGDGATAGGGCACQ